MPATTLPPASLWEQYSVVGILILVMVLIGLAARWIFREYRVWQSDEQVKQRAWQDEQSQIQRDWQSEQNKIRDAEQLKRDERWQEQVKNMSVNQAEQDRQTAAVLGKVLERMDALTLVLTLHDERQKETFKELLKK